MPIPLIVIGAVLLFFILLLLLRVRLLVLFEGEVALKLKILCFTFSLYPRNPNWKKHAKPKKAKQKKKKSKVRQAHEKKKGSLTDKLRLVRTLVAALIKKTHRHLRLHAAKLHIRVATGDAASTAILYGAVSQSLAYLLALLDGVTKLRATVPDVDVIPDFLAEKPSAEVKIVFSLRVYGAFAILFSVAFAYLRSKLKNKRKKKSTKHAARAVAR